MLTNNDGDTHSISVGISGMHITYYFDPYCMMLSHQADICDDPQFL